jgi:uncharacterized protein YcbK (DUF882 family)
MRYKHHSDVPATLWPFAFFTPREIASKGDGSILIDFDALNKLEAARRIAGKPFIISSAYRDPVHNARVGGAPMSMHKLGRAFDVSLQDHNRMALLRACEQAGFTGFGFYKNFLHLDTGVRRKWGQSWGF